MLKLRHGSRMRIILLLLLSFSWFVNATGDEDDRNSESADLALEQQQQQEDTSRHPHDMYQHGQRPTVEMVRAVVSRHLNGQALPQGVPGTFTSHLARIDGTGALRRAFGLHRQYTEGIYKILEGQKKHLAHRPQQKIHVPCEFAAMIPRKDLKALVRSNGAEFTIDRHDSEMVIRDSIGFFNAVRLLLLDDERDGTETASNLAQQFMSQVHGVDLDLLFEIAAATRRNKRTHGLLTENNGIASPNLDLDQCTLLKFIVSFFHTHVSMETFDHLIQVRNKHAIMLFFCVYPDAQLRQLRTFRLLDMIGWDGEALERLIRARNISPDIVVDYAVDSQDYSVGYDFIVKFSVAADDLKRALMRSVRDISEWKLGKTPLSSLNELFRFWERVLSYKILYHDLIQKLPDAISEGSSKYTRSISLLLISIGTGHSELAVEILRRIRGKPDLTLCGKLARAMEHLRLAKLIALLGYWDPPRSLDFNEDDIHLAIKSKLLTMDDILLYQVNSPRTFAIEHIRHTLKIYPLVNEVNIAVAAMAQQDLFRLVFSSRTWTLEQKQQIFSKSNALL